MNLSGTVIILPTPNLPQTHPQQHTAGIITDREHKADSGVVKKNFVSRKTRQYNCEGR